MSSVDCRIVANEYMRVPEEATILKGEDMCNVTEQPKKAKKENARSDAHTQKKGSK